MSGLSPSLHASARRPASTTARLALLLLVILPLAACANLRDLGDVLAGSSTPTAALSGMSLDDIGADGLRLLADVRVDNPLATALPLVDIGYTLTSGGARFVDGAAALDGSVPARGSRVVQLPIAVAYQDVLGVLSGVRPGSVVPYEAALTMNVDAPLLGPLSLPLSTTGELPVPTVPKVRVASVDWDELSLSRASGTLRLAVENTNDFPVDVDELSYGVALGGLDVASGRLTSTPSLEPGQSSTIEIPLSLSLSQLGSAALSVLGGDSADFAATGAFDLSTPFGPISMPFDEVGRTTLD